MHEHVLQAVNQPGNERHRGVLDIRCMDERLAIWVQEYQCGSQEFKLAKGWNVRYGGFIRVRARLGMVLIISF